MSKANLIRFVVRKNGRTGIYLVSSGIDISMEEVKDRMDKEIKQEKPRQNMAIIATRKFQL